MGTAVALGGGNGCRAFDVADQIGDIGEAEATGGVHRYRTRFGQGDTGALGHFPEFIGGEDQQMGGVAGDHGAFRKAVADDVVL